MKQTYLWGGLFIVALLLIMPACRNNDEDGQAAEEQPIAQPEQLPETQPQPEQPATTPEEQPAQPEAQPEQPATTPEEQPAQQTEPETQPEAQPVVDNTSAPVQQTGATVQHTVQEREWLVQIARCYGTSPQDILNANHIPHPGWIMAGEVWNIPNVGSVSTSVGQPCVFSYTVQQGDTLFSIANRYSIPLNMLVFTNYGCYGYNAHYDWSWITQPAVPELYESPVHLPAHLPGYDYGGCYYTSYPIIYPGDHLIIATTPENVSLRP